VSRALDALKSQPRYTELVNAEAEKIKALFENVFHHNEFTGRSGTFFAYEGLGSVYWHMVSKLLLAVQETILRTRNEPSSGALMEKYADIRKGLGFNKAPDVYGAFPTDPYSHTPKGQGAKQPGMTGLVKEEILTRQVELGLLVQEGKLIIDPLLLDSEEFLQEPSVFSWLDVYGETQTMELPAGSLAYTFCQVPIILQSAREMQIEVIMADGTQQVFSGNTLDADTSRRIFRRDGSVHHLRVHVIMRD
jgi:hypothetical protein